MNRFVLLNPGPVNVSERVRAALSSADLCHREAEFFDLQDDIRSRLLGVFGLAPTRHAAILLTGSGTSALEAAIASSVPPDRRLLVVDNGVYGDRIARIARAHGIAFDRIEAPWTERPDLARVENALASGRYGVLAAVHHETTTGLCNQATELGRLAAERGVLFVVDSVSGLAGEDFDFDASGAGLVACTANKCLQGLPGMSFVIARREALERMASLPPRTLYLHLPEYYAQQSRRSTPFTPAIQVAFAFREALAELGEETVPRRIARYRRASALLRERFERMGLEFLLAPELRSNTITTLRLPRGVSYPELHDEMKRRGYVIYAGQGALSETAFRVANMGWIAEAALAAFADHLEEFLAWKR